MCTINPLSLTAAVTYGILHAFPYIGLLGASQEISGSWYCRSKPRQGHLLSDTRNSQSPRAISLSSSGSGRALGRQPEDWRYICQHSESIPLLPPSLPPSFLLPSFPLSLYSFIQTLLNKDDIVYLSDSALHSLTDLEKCIKVPLKQGHLLYLTTFYACQQNRSN